MLHDDEYQFLEALYYSAVTNRAITTAAFAESEVSGVVRKLRDEADLLVGIPTKAGKGSLILEWPELPEQSSIPSRAGDTFRFFTIALLGSAYEILKKNHQLKDDAMWEFFRHCRNGAFHGNRFNFSKSEPSRSAEWRGLVIDKSLQNKQLIGDYIEVGDVYLLLGDVTWQIGIPAGKEEIFPRLQYPAHNAGTS